MPLIELLNDSDNYVIGRPPQIIETRDAYPCILIAAYSEDIAGVLGHFAEPEDSAKFREMIGWIAGNLDASRLEITLAGASYDSLPNDAEGRKAAENINRHRQGKRDYVIGEFLKLGVPDSRIRRWFPNENTVTDILLNTKNGGIEITGYGVDDLLRGYVNNNS